MYVVQDKVVFGTVRRRITVKVEPNVAQAPQHVKEALHEGHNDEADQAIDVDEAGQGMDIDDAEVKQPAPLRSPTKRRKPLCGPCASCGICGELATTLNYVFCCSGKGRCCCMTPVVALSSCFCKKSTASIEMYIKAHSSCRGVEVPAMNRSLAGQMHKS